MSTFLGSCLARLSAAEYWCTNIACQRMASCCHMHAVLTVTDDREVTAVAMGFDEADAAALAARHIMQSYYPSWPDIVTAFEAGVYEQVVELWNQNRHEMPEPVEYRIVDMTAAVEELAARER